MNLYAIKSRAVTIGGSQISMTLFDSVKSIGATLDSTLSLERQISAICKSVWYNLYLISRIKKYLITHEQISVIRAYVTSQLLDQNNSLLIRLHKKSPNWPQMVQNTSARLIMGLTKTHHITHTLIQLYWLPVDKCVIFKVLLVYKSLYMANVQNPSQSFLFYMSPQML